MCGLKVNVLEDQGEAACVPSRGMMWSLWLFVEKVPW